MMRIRTNTLRNATTQRRKEVFAVESRLVTSNGQTIRKIVIFDNHPASLRLLSAHFAPRRTNESLYAVFAIGLVLAIGVGIILAFVLKALEELEFFRNRRLRNLEKII